MRTVASPESVGAADPPVTVIRELRVRTGQEAEFERLMRLLVEEAMRQPGHLGASVARPGASHNVYRFIYNFDRRSNLIAWHESETRARLFRPVAPLIELDRFDEHSGLERWFERPGDAQLPAPPKWKTTLMSWAAIYVLVVVVGYALDALRLQPPMLLRALVLTAIVVPLVAYVVGPWLSRAFHGWLHAGLTMDATDQADRPRAVRRDSNRAIRSK